MRCGYLLDLFLLHLDTLVAIVAVVLLLVFFVSITVIFLLGLILIDQMDIYG
jgi:hypothetical protein